METHLQQLMTFCFVTNFVLTTSMVSYKSQLAVTSQPIMIRLEPDEIVDSVKSIFESRFLRELDTKTESEPTKGVGHDAENDGDKVMKEELQQILKEDSLEVKTTERPVEKSDVKSPKRKKPNKRIKQRPKKKKKVVLNEELALALLRDPSPDGDNLGLDSLEQPATEPPVPMKINGIYMRKHILPVDKGVVKETSSESDSDESIE